MAFLVDSGTFLGAASTGDQSITGVGFQPKALLIFSTGQTSLGPTVESRMLVGMATSSTDRGVLTYTTNSGEATSDVDHDNRDNQVILIRSFSGGTVIGEADFVSFDADGFTINWTNTQVSHYSYVALGGSDLTDAKFLKFLKPTSTGNDSVTGIGFQPDTLIFMGNLGTVANAVADHSSFFFSAARSTSERWTTNVCSEDGVGTSNTCRHQRTDRAIAQTDESGTIVSEADFVSMDADGFTLNYSTADGNASIYFVLALKGGRTKVGSFNASTSTGNQSITGVSFQPVGNLYASFCAATNASVMDDHLLSLSVGISSTERHCSWASDEDGQATTDTSRTMEDDRVFKTLTAGTTASINHESDFVSQDSDGFTWNNLITGAISREILYLAMGDAALIPVAMHSYRTRRVQ